METEVRIFLSSSTSAILEIPAPIIAPIINDQYARFLAQQSINKRDSSFHPSFVCFQHLKQISLINALAQTDQSSFRSGHCYRYLLR